MSKLTLPQLEWHLFGHCYYHIEGLIKVEVPNNQYHPNRRIIIISKRADN
jgi:hypothetical protein